MTLRTRTRTRLLVVSLLLAAPLAFWMPARPAAARAVESEKTLKRRYAAARPVIWRDPGDVRARNLFYGPGSAARSPAPPFTFIEEDRSGESPKFEVRDARGVRWKVKLGPEAQAETVATRLVWAAGYFAEEAYYLERVRVRGLPRLSRGREFVSGDTARGARFEPRRAGLVRGPTWDWSDNPFEGRRELDGLKVLMILLNNYDARAANNRVFYAGSPGRGAEARYYVADLGATLGKSDGLGGNRSKNDLPDFLSTRFVTGVEGDGSVEFDYDTRPTGLGIVSILYPPYYRGEVKKEKAMRGIPVEHAAWIGSRLARLSDAQLHDAFRAARYDRATADGYVRALRRRINQLTRLAHR
ncbi:MAG TPA: hypothetical protein VEY09_14845 [Pyrinomonadaceae bacterium]|nr:hypothetical protein [Pyrinomonadaceae bacterium]